MTLKKILIIITILLLTLPLSVQAKGNGVLYLWNTGENIFTWKTFGDDDLHQKYIGEIKGDKPNGYGLLYFPDGKKVMGEWKDGKELNTKHFNKDGKVIGKWLNGKQLMELYAEINFRGEPPFDKNGLQEFSWSYDDPHPEYHLKNFETVRYVGEIKNGKPHGRGTFFHPGIAESFSESYKYVGEFSDGDINGKGTMTFLDNDGIPLNKYVGEFNDFIFRLFGYFDGHGTIDEVSCHYNSASSGRPFNSLGKKSVTLIYPDYDIYGNKILHPERMEKGKHLDLTCNNYGKYVGEWKGGFKHGDGTETFPDGKYLHPDVFHPGRKYVGVWRDGLKWNVTGYDKDRNIIGKYENGTIKYDFLYYCINKKGGGDWTESHCLSKSEEYKNTDGKPLVGTYLGEIIEGGMGQNWSCYSLPNGKGAFNFPDRSKFVGEWKNGKINDKGKFIWFDSQRTQWDGFWDKDKMPIIIKDNDKRKGNVLEIANELQNLKSFIGLDVDRLPTKQADAPNDVCRAPTVTAPTIRAQTPDIYHQLHKYIFQSWEYFWEWVGGFFFAPVND
jgi:hypothetical protein